MKQFMIVNMCHMSFNRTPARMSSTLSVAASNINDTLPVWSNHGPCTAITAPGQNIIGPSIVSDTAFMVASGTSMSTPHVVGMAARYLSSLPDHVAAVTSPYRVMAALADLSTKGTLELVDKPRLASPNHLLYKMCDNWRMQALEAETTTQAFRTTTRSPTTTTTQSQTDPPTSTMTSHTAKRSNDKLGEMTISLLGITAAIAGAGCGMLALMNSIIMLK